MALLHWARTKPATHTLRINKKKRKWKREKLFKKVLSKPNINMKKRKSKSARKNKKNSRKPSNKDKNSKLKKLKAYQRGQRVQRKNRSLFNRIAKAFRRK